MKQCYNKTIPSRQYFTSGRKINSPRSKVTTKHTIHNQTKLVTLFKKKENPIMDERTDQSSIANRRQSEIKDHHTTRL